MNDVPVVEMLQSRRHIGEDPRRLADLNAPALPTRRWRLRPGTYSIAM